MQNQNQSQKIQNPETQVPNTPELNDRDYIDLMLNDEKKMTTMGYGVALNEASNEFLYNQLFQIYQETQEKQREIYNLMFQKGWYSVSAEPKQKLTQTYQKFQGYMPQIQ
jgi:spore coat protein CotF